MRRRSIGFREALCMRGFMKTCACCSLRVGARFCSESHGVYTIKEDGARIGQPNRVIVHCLLPHNRSTVMLPAAPQVPGPNGEETIAGCVARAQISLPSHSLGTKLQNTEQLHFIFTTQEFATVHSQNPTVHTVFIWQFGCLRTQPRS